MCGCAAYLLENHHSTKTMASCIRICVDIMLNDNSQYWPHMQTTINNSKSDHIAKPHQNTHTAYMNTDGPKKKHEHILIEVIYGHFQSSTEM
jgi:hypothetical protein